MGCRDAVGYGVQGAVGYGVQGAVGYGYGVQGAVGYGVQGCSSALWGRRTSRVAAQDEFAHFVVGKDEQTVGEGAEPPGDPKRGGGRGGRQLGVRDGGGVGGGVGGPHLRGYMRSATPIPGQ